MNVKLSTVLLSICATPGVAHPHLFVDAGLEFQYHKDRLVSVTVTWEYDEFSTMLMIEDAGLDGDGDMIPDADRLRAFAGKDVDWAAGFPGDLLVEQGDRTIDLGPARDFQMAFSDGRLTSRHSRPLTTPVEGGVKARVFDPGYFVAYSMALPITVSGTDRCKTSYAAADLDAAYTLVEELLYGPRASEFDEDNYPEVGIHFADTLTVTCAASS